MFVAIYARTRNASASIKVPAVYKTFHDKEDGCVDIVPHRLPVAPPRPMTRPGGLNASTAN
ncbi:MAG: hypothetical protein E6G88_02175 [Alphaproteobacteria bacterium]|nr:MAG: hypothetical protein E6G88_02175 [Alphaproteobacteria bacterium]